MLIAPIFHNSYLSPKSLESQNKSSDATSSGSSSTKTIEASVPNKYNNIFKTAFNRGITFLSKIANNSGSNSPSTSSTKIAESETNHDSSSSETPSDCSSPDSLKTEMIFFKPISREPKTPLSTTKPLRVPSIRSAASSTDRFISSPCPSPFFIPITPRRQSAFSFVGFHEKDAESQTILKPKPTKRKNVKTSTEKSESNQKRIKRGTETTPQSARKTLNFVEKAKAKVKTEKVVVSRKTRSMEKKEEAAIKRTQKEFKTQPKLPVKRSPQKKQPVELVVQVKRVTRSQSLKH